MAAGCGDSPEAAVPSRAAGTSSTAPSAPRPLTPPPPGADRPRGPAGEVPPNSRRAHDEGTDGAPAVPGYSYGFPGVPGTGTHYHVLVPDAGEPSAALAGGRTDRALAVRVFRTGGVVDAAVSAREALAGTGAEILDPVTSGGCGDGADHPHPGSGLRSPPPVRVVRARLPAADLARRDRALEGVPGLRRILARTLGGEAGGEIVLDVHLVP